MAPDDLIIGLGRTPVPGAAPVGADAKYDPAYEAVEAEIAKLQSVSDDRPDWAVVADHSRAILADKSKDLKIATFLCCALYETEGLCGLQAGLTILTDLIETYWDDLFPPLKRVRARANALGWIANYLADPLAAHKASEADDEAAVAAYALIRQLDGAAADKLGDQAPLLGEVRRALEQLAQAAEARQKDQAAKAEAAAKQAGAAGQEGSDETKAAATAPPAAAPPPPPKAAPAPKPAPAAPPAGVPADDKEAKQRLRDLSTSMRDMARYRREINPGDPVAYQLARLAAWAQVHRLPPHQDGRTDLPPLEEERRTLVEQAAGSDPAQAIKAAEAAIADSLFWLTPHRLCAGALEALGHAAAAAAIRESLASLLRRLPGLERLSFQDGTPFADPLTLSWIEEDVLAGPAASGGARSADAPDPWIQAGKEAQKLAGSGKLDEAGACLAQGRSSAQGRREQFAWELEQARLCLIAGKPFLAAPALEALDGEAERMGLADWEPALAVKLAESLLTCYADKGLKSKLNEAQQQRLERQRALLARLDLALALKLGHG